MTTHPAGPSPHSRSPYSLSRSSTSEFLSGPGSLIAAVPALLGFTPHRSLILICLEPCGAESIQIGTVMRHDLTLPEHDPERDHPFGVDSTAQMHEVIARYAQFCARNEVRVALAVIVDDRASSRSTRMRADARFGAIARRLTSALHDARTVLAQVLLVPDIAIGARWTSIAGEPGRGLIPDPFISPVAVANAVEGRVVHESRTALERVLEPVSNRESHDVAAELDVLRGREIGSDRTELAEIVGQIEEWFTSPRERPAPIELPADRIARFGVALTRVMVRDSLLALTLTEYADVAEQLWTLLMRMLPAPERACPASLLGFSAYGRGGGALAAIAIDTALGADPDYSLARLLDRSLSAGARPEMIREVAVSGYAVAELCGVPLPPPVD